MRALGWMMLAAWAVSNGAFAGSGTWVGNGDDGSDLEGATPLKSEKILTSRSHAIELLRKLNIAGVAGLGSLIPEVERSPLYMSKVDSPARLGSDQGGFHTDMKGRVFARTLAEPLSPTRFFPVSEKLDDDQLVALHVHEALHRSLPASIREDEAIVSEIALSIVSPESSHDQVRKTAAKLIPVADTIAMSSSSVVAPAETSSPAPEASFAVNPSLVGYEFRNYWNNPELSSVNRMHLLRSFLYPFGSKQDSFGFGIQASLIQQPAATILGPLGLSARVRLWSGRGFDIAAWGECSLNTLSAAELKNSPFGRDVGTFGLEMRKDLRFFYVENVLGYSLPGSAKETIGRVEYKYGYGGVMHVAVHTGVTLAFIKLGGFADIYLADYYQAQGGAFPLFDTGRYRLVSAGPEATLRIENLAVSAYGKFLLSAPEDVEFDSLGNLMGAGSGQASLGARLSMHF